MIAQMTAFTFGGWFRMPSRFRKMREMISMIALMAEDAPARPGMLSAFMALFVTLAVAAMVAPTAASAQLSFVDPTTNVQSTASGWFGSAQTIANDIFHVLIVLEFTIVGIQFALFRDSFTELMGTLVWKIVSAGIFLWFISQAATIFPAIINSFTSAAQQLDPNAGGSALVQLALKIFAACALVYVSAGTSQGEQQIASVFSGPFLLGYGFAGEANGLPIANTTNILLSEVIVFLLISSFAVIVLQWVLTTIESYIVMFAGVMFLGFAGSRWTMPFAQGYLSYAVNVGVKLFTLYLILSVENNLMNGVLLPIGAAAIAMAVDFTGATGALNLALLFWAALQVMIMAAIAYAIPNLAGSFLSGQSSLSGSQAMSMMSGAMSSMAMMNSSRSGAALASERGKHAGGQLASFHNHGGSTAGAAAGAQVGADVGAIAGSVVPNPTGNIAPGANAPGAQVAGSSPAGANGVGVPGGTSGSNFYNVGVPSANGSPAGGAVPIRQTSPASMPPPSVGAPSPVSQPGAQSVGVAPIASVASGSGAQAVTPLSGPVDSSTPGSSTAGGGPGSLAAPPPPVMPGNPASLQARIQNASQPSAGTPSASSGNFNSVKAADVAAMGPSEATARAGSTDWASVPTDVRAALDNNRPAHDAVERELELEEAQFQQMEDQSNAYAMSSMSQALPRSDPPPAAIQVRMSQSDKL